MQHIGYENEYKKFSLDIETLRACLYYHYLLKYTGNTLMIAGFILWYLKLQRYQDGIVKNQAEENK